MIEKIKELLRNNQRFLEDSLCSLFEFQEIDEKMVGTTIHKNAVGFNSPDANSLSYYAEWILKGNHLNGKFLDDARNRLIKYCGQLEKIISIKCYEDFFVFEKNETINIKLSWNTEDVSIKFDYDKNLVDLIKTSEKRKYNPYDKSWTIFYTEKNVKFFNDHFEVFGVVPEFVKPIKIIDYLFFIDENGIVVCKTVYDDYIISLIRTLPKDKKNWDRDNKVWNIDLTYFNYIIEDIHKYLVDNNKTFLFKDIDMSFLNEKVEDLDDIQKEINNLFPFLRNYQKIDIAKVIKHKRTLNSNDMGLGKTIESGGAIKYLNLPRNLIIAPKSVIRQWQEELKKFYNLDAIVIEDGKKRFKQYEELKEMDNFIIIVNYAKVRIDFDIFFSLFTFDFVVFDEITKLKNPRTKTYVKVKEMKYDRVTGLTGTPIENKLEELHAICNLIDFKFFGTFSTFCYKYLDAQHLPDSQFIGFRPKIGAIRQISEKLSNWDCFIRWKKTEVLEELPELIQNYYRFQLTSKERRLYHSIKKGYAELYNDKGELLQIDKIIARIQVIGGFCSEPNIYFKDIEKSSKKLLFLELIEDYINGDNLNRKVVAFTKYKRVAKSYTDFLTQKGHNVIMVAGGDSKFHDKVTKWKEMKESCILICTDKLSHGVNLQVASYMINIDLPYNPSILGQRIARIWRMGQKERVNVINLVAENTFEERIVELVFSKIETFDDIITINESSNKDIIAEEFEDTKNNNKINNDNIVSEFVEIKGGNKKDFTIDAYQLKLNNTQNKIIIFMTNNDNQSTANIRDNISKSNGYTLKLLKELEEKKLIKKEKDGRMFIWKLNYEVDLKT